MAAVIQNAKDIAVGGKKNRKNTISVLQEQGVCEELIF